MTKITHDPSEYIKGIYSILINSKKRIGFLFGAGTSQAKKDGIKSITVPAIYELTKIVEEEVLKEKDKEDTPIYKEVIDSLKEDLKDKYNIETMLSILEQKHLIIGNNNLNGLNKSGFEDLILLIKTIIRKRMSVHNEIVDCDAQVQTDFSRWIGKADRTFGIEIFTTNYDYLFEIGLEQHDIAYYDGFSGSYKPFFNSESVEDFKYLPFQTKLWKIHGSIGWHIDKKTDKIIRDSSNNDDIFIFPSIFKYKDSQKQPYVSLLDRLTNFLKQDDTVLFTCGYAFNDEHINGRILSALNVDKNSHVIALYWDEYKNDGSTELSYSLNKESHLYKLATSNSKLSVLGFRSAIIGRQLGKWKLRKEPDIDETPHVNLYFDEDHHTDITDELNKELSVKWSGEGKFIIPDFAHFVMFLNSMIVENSLSNAIKRDGIK
jgi:hypothetical protein